PKNSPKMIAARTVAPLEQSRTSFDFEYEVADEIHKVVRAEIVRCGNQLRHLFRRIPFFESEIRHGYRLQLFHGEVLCSMKTFRACRIAPRQRDEFLSEP